MEIERGGKRRTGDKTDNGGRTDTVDKVYSGDKNRSRAKRYVRTPGGANLGERVMRNGCTYLKHKDGNKYEELSPETVVECICGKKVDHIVYMADAEVVVGK